MHGLKATALSPASLQSHGNPSILLILSKNYQPLTTHFPKNNNPRPGKDAIQPQSTDGQQNELNDRRNTEKETKLVKNRNKITKELIELKEEARCKAEKLQHLRIPGSCSAVILPFC